MGHGNAIIGSWRMRSWNREAVATGKVTAADQLALSRRNKSERPAQDIG